MSTKIKGKKNSSSFKRNIYESRYLYILFFLPLAYFLIFKYGAISWILLAFKDFKPRLGLWGSEWVRLKHFRNFVSTPDFSNLIRNTVLLSVYNLAFSFPVPIILAIMLNEVRKSNFKKTFQSITYLPHFFSTVVICGMLVNFLTTDGIINNLIGVFGVKPIQFLMEPKWFRIIYIASGIWQNAGWGSIMYLAALSGIDPQLYESAVIDGASKFQQIKNVTLPGIRSVISIQFLLNVGNMLNIGSEKILLLYNGATYETADVISTYVYRRGLVNADYGYGTAVSLFQSVISFILIIVVNKIAKKVGETSLW